MTIGDGNTPEAADVLQIAAIEQIYTGSGFDVSSTGVGDSDSASHELTAIASSKLGDVNYLIISILATSTVDPSTTVGSKCNYLIETKPVGGSYATSLATTAFRSDLFPGSAADTMIHTNTFTWVHTLTASEISDGVQVKITASTSTGGGGGSSSPAAGIANVQTILAVRP